MVCQQTAILDDGGPPYIVAYDTVCGRELLPTDIRLIIQSAGQHIRADGEFSPHGLHEGVVSLLLRCVGQLHVQWLQDLVKGASGIADETVMGGRRGRGEGDARIRKVYYGN